MKALPENIVLAVREIKSAIVRAQSRVAANANTEMLSLYFGIGQYVSHKTKTEKWGTGVIDAISHRLQQEMPGLRGFSAQSIRRMRQFYETWADVLIWPPAAAKLEHDAKDGAICSPAVSKLEFAGDRLAPAYAPTVPRVTPEEFMSLGFSHHMTIISQTDTIEERLFYIHEAAQRRWSREQLTSSIKRDDFRHRGAMPGNFMATIPDAALARKTLAMFRDEYLLDFVNLDDIEAADSEDVDERVLEKSIVANIQKFIMEFGRDFSFVGNQYRVEAAGHEHFIDLLFFKRARGGRTQKRCVQAHLPRTNESLFADTGRCREKAARKRLHRHHPLPVGGQAVCGIRGQRLQQALGCCDLPHGGGTTGSVAQRAAVH